MLVRNIYFPIVVVFLLLLSPVIVFSSDSSAEVDVALRGCASISIKEVNRILDLELGRVIANRPNILSSPRYVEALCEKNTVRLEVRDPRDNKQNIRRTPFTLRNIQRTTNASGLERLIAIAAAELVVSSWTTENETSGESTEVAAPLPLSNRNGNVASDEAPRQPVREPGLTIRSADTPSSPARDSVDVSPASVPNANRSQASSGGEDAGAQSQPAESETIFGSIAAPSPSTSDVIEIQWRLDHLGKSRFPQGAVRIAPMWQVYFNGGSHLFGGEASGLFYPTRRLFFDVGLAAGAGRDRNSVGNVALLSMTGAISAGTAGAMPSVPFEWRLSAGFRGGFGRLKGRSSDDAVTGVTVIGGCGGFFGRVSASSTTRFGAGLSLEVGYDIYGNIGRVARNAAVEMKGFRLSLSLDLLYYFKQRDRT